MSSRPAPSRVLRCPARERIAIPARAGASSPLFLRKSARRAASARLAPITGVQAPAVVPALAVIAGIACGVLAPSLRPYAAPALVASLAAALVAWRASHARAFGALILAGFGAAGALLGAVDAERAMRTPLAAFFADYTAQPGGGAWPLTIEGRLRGDATPTDYGASITLEVERARTPCGWLPAEGGARLAVSGTLAAGALAGWREGRRVRLPASLRIPTRYRDPGVQDESLALARRGIALVGSVKSGSLVEVVARGSAMQEAASAIRARVRRTVRRLVPGDALRAGIVTAILIGDRGGLDPTTTRRLQEAGTYHVIAISGGNIVILAGLAFVVLRLLRVPRRGGSIALAALLCAYGYIAGGGPSVARATIAAVVYLLAVAADHRSPAMNVLAAVALVAVAYEPLEVFDPGLALSYGATLALLVAADRVRLGKRNAILAVLAGTICAELALFPIGASVFHRVTVAGLILNFAAIPLMTVVQVAGLAVLAAAPFFDVLARAAGTVAGLASVGLVESTRLLDVAPWLTWRVPSPAWSIVGVYYAAWALALWGGVIARLRYRALAVAASAALMICVPSLTRLARPRPAPAAGMLRATFLDVGQGDAAVVQFPGGWSLLVDAAGLPASAFDLGERVITPALLALGVQRLDYLAITHGDPDHVEGAPGVARDFGPRELWEGIVVPPHRTLNDLRRITSRGGGALRTVRPGDIVRLGGVDVRVLHPPEPDWERQRVRNDDSIVLEIRYGDVSIVLPGDISAPTEEPLATRLSDAPLRILKAAHHGSATSSSAAWLDAARAAAVVFSCGRGNRYGHPHPAVLDRAASRRTPVFRTDEDGAITVTTDGRTAHVETFTGRSLELAPRPR